MGLPMSNDRVFWELKFVDAFVTKPKRPRYKKLLPDPRKRDKILNRLNHNADLDFRRGVELLGRHKCTDELIQRLLTYDIEAQGWLISDDADLDCKLLPLREAVELTTNADWGTILICPP